MPADRTITVPALYMGMSDAVLTLDTRDGESGEMTLTVDGVEIARGGEFRAAQVGPSLLEMSDAQLAGMFGAFLAHALESSEDDARDGWTILEDGASEWTDALTLMEEDENREPRTLAEFIDAHGITADVEYADSNPNMNEDRRYPMNHYAVTLRAADRTMVVPFSTGSGWTREPSAADVLDCLASDASSVENEPDWFDWAQDMGYSEPMELRGARETYKTIVMQSEELKALLGDDAYSALLWGVERL